MSNLMASVTVTLDPATRRSIGSTAATAISTFDRTKWIGGHWSLGANGWSDDEIALFGASGYRTHPGRAFVVSGLMSQLVEDPARPGFVDAAALVEHCTAHPPVVRWPVADLNFVCSSKPNNFYNNSCSGPGGKRSKGFVPGSHAATAEFFALYYAHCMAPTPKPYALFEVANECNVKTGKEKCDTTWGEMVALHVAVADALHAAHADADADAHADADADARASSPLPKPLVCGPTAAFPEYQLEDFKDWRVNGTFYEFVQTAGGAVDCLSIHFYTSARSDPTDPNPFSKNMSWRSGGNMLASLDLQEVATATLRSAGFSGGIQTALAPLPLLVSEYGVSFKAPKVIYDTAHDWWILRGVNGKLMHFLDRPDRILRALPFITGKAVWDVASFADNSSHSYPFVLWRNVTSHAPPHAPVWLPTHLSKFFEVWQDVWGDRFVASSSDANVQVQAFASAPPTGVSGSSAASSTMFVVLHNLRPYAGEEMTVALQWPAAFRRAAASATSSSSGKISRAVAALKASVRRLRWDDAAMAPSVTNEPLGSDALPGSITLQPGELAVLTVDVSATEAARLLLNSTVIETTLYSDRGLFTPLALSAAAAAAMPFTFNLPPPSIVRRTRRVETAAVTTMRLRLSLGGANASLAGALAGLHVVVNGNAYAVDAATMVAGPPHVQPKDGSTLTAIEVPVNPAHVLRMDALPRNGAEDDEEVAVLAEVDTHTVTVQVWSADAGGLIISTAVLVVGRAQ